ncbi:unnamed protein product [Parajaminaea phylloscopi]
MSQLCVKVLALKYDTVDIKTGIWHGFALVVTEDGKSDYSVTPTIRARWQPASQQPGQVQGDEAVAEENAQRTYTAIKLHEYKGEPAAHTMWRFKIEVPMADVEQRVTYSLEGQAHPDSQPPAITEATSNSFFVPASDQDFRWIGHSCNGFSASLDPKEWNGPNPLWDDTIREHQKRPFHAVVGGGDQIYNDKLTGEPEMQDWVNQKDPKLRMAMPLTDEMSTAIDRYLFNHYIEWFGSGSFSKVIAQVPMMNMLDDHDLIDGFGTYPDDLMRAPVFNAIGSKGIFWYLIFQQFMKMEVDGKDDTPGKHSNRSIIIAGDGKYVPFPNQSFLAYMGPKQWLLMVDCRSERSIETIVTRQSYDKIFSRVRSDVPAGVDHLVILLGVPLAYPRMVFLERTLSSSLNPFIMLAKGLSPGFTNSFNGQVELLDDLGDHWCAGGPHKKERNKLICDVNELALEKHFRVSWISGDVHCASASVLHSSHSHDPARDPKFSLQVVTSAIVNAPPPPAVIAMLNRLAQKKHRTLLWAGIAEHAVPTFEEGLDGQKQKAKYIAGARNWCAVTLDPASKELEFELRVEKSKGSGECKSYPLRTPAPAWEVKKEHRHLLHTKGFDKFVESHLARHHAEAGKGAGEGGKVEAARHPIKAAVA